MILEIISLLHAPLIFQLRKRILKLKLITVMLLPVGHDLSLL